MVAEFIGPPKVYTFSFIVGNIIARSVKCIHSATKSKERGEGFAGYRGLDFEVQSSRV